MNLTSIPLTTRANWLLQSHMVQKQTNAKTTEIVKHSRGHGKRESAVQGNRPTRRQPEFFYKPAGLAPNVECTRRFQMTLQLWVGCSLGIPCARAIATASVGTECSIGPSLLFGKTSFVGSCQFQAEALATSTPMNIVCQLTVRRVEFLHPWPDHDGCPPTIGPRRLPGATGKPDASRWIVFADLTYTADCVLRSGVAGANNTMWMIAPGMKSCQRWGCSCGRPRVLHSTSVCLDAKD